MSRTSLEKWAMFLLRMALGLVFFYAGILKMRQPIWLFEASIASFRIVPDAYVGLMASSLPFFEAIAGFWFILGWQIRSAAFALLLLNLIFVGVLGQALMRGLNVNCGCFGAEPSPAIPLWVLFFRDLFLLASIGLVFCTASRGSLEIFSSRFSEGSSGEDAEEG